MFKVSWFWELLPEQKIIEEQLLDIIKNSYKQFWYTSIETPAVEKNTVLTAKWWDESLKQIFWLYGLAQGCEDKKKYSLHFDLTVPFARYVIDHKDELTFPFKRNQIQKVWRWERAQRWRFREFYQADIDVIWEDINWKDWNLFYDAEVIFTVINTLDKILKDVNIDKTVFVNINHKKLILWFLKEIWLEEIKEKITNIIDKKDKISKEDFINELTKLNIDKEKQEKILDFANIETFDIENIKNININNEEWRKWISELEYISNILESFWMKDKVKINLSIMRWLDYYTWMVFETFIEWERSLGSISSWWRYENFTKFIDNKTNFSWVGWSIWISRLETYIFEHIKTTQKTSTEYLLINFKETQENILKLYVKLSKLGKYIEYYPTNDKLWKQFKYADKKWIKYCIILWEQELEKWQYQIKDMETWESFYENI